MTPKEKADELVSKFYSKSDEKSLLVNKYWSNAKFCALIAVDEMQLVMSSMWKVAGIDEQHRSTYLEEVKKEIEKL